MRRLVIAWSVLAVVAAGCANGPLPTAAPPTSAGALAPSAPPASAAPIETPSVDLPAALRAILSEPGPYTLRMDRTQGSDTTTSRILGTMRVTPHAWAASGTRTDQAIGSTMVATASYEMVWIGDSGFTKSQAGPWIPFAGLFDHPLRLTADPDAGTFVVTGSNVVAGRTLHRLGYADPSVIDPVFLLAIGNELRDVEAEATYELTSDGRLVRMRSTLSARREEQFGGSAVTHTAEYTVIDASPGPIEPPDTDWTLYRSPTLPISLALPPEWRAGDAGEGGDRLDGPDGIAELRVRQALVTSTPAELVDAVQREYRERGAGEPSSIVPTYLGSETAVAVIYRGVDLGSGSVNVVHLVTVYDRTAYDVVWTMQPGVLQDQFDLIGHVATSWSWGATER